VLETIIGIFLVICYLAPAILAELRNHKNVYGILMSSVFLNWTVVGWFANLHWSMSKRKDM
jgi:hypothetical protein